MVALKWIAMILASIVALDHIDETEGGWGRVIDQIRIPPIRIPPIRKATRRPGDIRRKSTLFCPEVYGIACKTANVEIGKRNNIDFSGTGCKVDSSKACENQKRELSPTTADGLKYVPLPPDFGFYDTNKDDKITFEEFSAQILPRYPIHDLASLKTMFTAADADADEVLDTFEFSLAPFVQVTLHTGGEEISNQNERNAVEDESKYEQSQTSENEA